MFEGIDASGRTTQAKKYDYKGTIINNLIKYPNRRSSDAQHYSIKSLLIRTVASMPRRDSVHVNSIETR